VASKLLKELHRDAKTDGNWLLRWVHSFSRFTHRKIAGLGSAEKINALLKTVPLLSMNHPLLSYRYTSFQPSSQSEFLIDALLCFTVDAESQREGPSARMLRDQKILLGTTYDLMASAADRSPSALETLGEDKVQKILQLSMVSSVTQVFRHSFLACIAY